MAKDTTKDVAKREGNELSEQAKINEAYFVGLMWSDPFNHYAEFKDKISQDEFIHDIWGFFYEFGRKMFEDGIKRFDDITVHMKAKEYDIAEELSSYDGMNQIEDAIEIVREHSDNIEYYFETIKKSYVIRQLVLLFGAKVLIKKNKYDHKKMNAEQLMMYWNDKVNKLALNGVNNYEAENLYIDPELFIKKLEEESAEMLPFHNSILMNSVTQGVARGHVTMFGGFGNTGKSSIMADKFVMSCIANREKLIIVLNEEDAQSFRQKIVLSILNHEFNVSFDRKRMVNGKLQESDKELIRKAFKRMEELIDGDETQIKVLFMEKYVMKDLEKIIRFWAGRGYINLLIDTHKVSDDSPHEKRWEIFVEDMKTIYRMTRKNAGGLNLRTVVTFQLADSAVKNRYLGFDAMAEGKGAKNEASVLMMFRPLFADEYEGGKKALKCYRLKKKANGKFDKEYFELEKDKPYYLVFYPKNRFGANTDNNQPVLVLEPAFHKNAFYEKGWTFVAKEYAS